MDFVKATLARQILKTLADGQAVATFDALRLRN
jgi:hypothetical protein